MSYKVTVMDQRHGVVVETSVDRIDDIEQTVLDLSRAIERATKPVCSQCDGQGVYNQSFNPGPGKSIEQKTVKCNKCNGTGRLGEKYEASTKSS